jgi:hypothetical protein
MSMGEIAMNATPGSPCIACGAVLGVGTQFCTTCGVPQAEAKEGEARPKKALVGAMLAGVTGQVTAQASLSHEELNAGLLFKGMSHESGRNADISLYVDRIERVKQRSRIAFSKAHQEVEITPIRTIGSVQTKKDGFYTKVIVYAVGNPIEFRFRHEHAQMFKEQIQTLILNYVPPSGAVSPPYAPDIPEQLLKLAGLRDTGIITPDEFEAKKIELLARL